ncbi:MAG TPA: type II toxin-antitoxin system HicB family antitoxin [Nitrospirae bacterium]|nr:type II toxin-antitoxin system HicB family antitoxin [Nitrospirota bacterium]
MRLSSVSNSGLGDPLRSIVLRIWPFSGKFVVRVPPDVHREAFLKAKNAGKSLNAWVTEAIKKSSQG